MNIIRCALLCVWAMFWVQPLYAQHEGHKPPPAKPAATPAAPKPAVPKAAPQPSPQEAEDTSHAGMDHGLVVVEDDQMFVRVGDSHANLMPMGRMGSGTSWQPASTAMPMRHKQSGDWLLMFHYNFVAGVNAQGGPRGVTKLES